MKVKSKKAERSARDRKALVIDDFKIEIAKAERGQFYTIAEAKELLAAWRKKKDFL